MNDLAFPHLQALSSTMGLGRPGRPVGVGAPAPSPLSQAVVTKMTSLVNLSTTTANQAPLRSFLSGQGVPQGLLPMLAGAVYALASDCQKGGLAPGDVFHFFQGYMVGALRPTGTISQFGIDADLGNGMGTIYPMSQHPKLTPPLRASIVSDMLVVATLYLAVQAAGAMTPALFDSPAAGMQKVPASATSQVSKAFAALTADAATASLHPSQVYDLYLTCLRELTTPSVPRITILSADVQSFMQSRGLSASNANKLSKDIIAATLLFLSAASGFAATGAAPASTVQVSAASLAALAAGSGSSGGGSGGASGGGLEMGGANPLDTSGTTFTATAPLPTGATSTATPMVPGQQQPLHVDPSQLQSFVTATAPATPPAVVAPSHTALYVAGGIAVAALVGGGLYFAMRAPPTPPAPSPLLRGRRALRTARRSS